MRNKTRYVCLFIAFTVVVLAGTVHAGEILDAVVARDSVRCGVSTGLAGFSIADSTGHWTGLDADFCRGLAAAVLGDGAKVTYVPLPTSSASLPCKRARSTCSAAIPPGR